MADPMGNREIGGMGSINLDAQMCAQKSPSLAGTAETMTDRDVRWLKLHISEEADITEYPLEGFEARALATYAALAERTAECEERQGELDAAHVRGDALHVENTALRASLATAQEDTRRLDWLDDIAQGDKNISRAVSIYDDRTELDFRQAIDAASSHATPEGE